MYLSQCKPGTLVRRLSSSRYKEFYVVAIEKDDYYYCKFHLGNMYSLIEYQILVVY